MVEWNMKQLAMSNREMMVACHAPRKMLCRTGDESQDVYARRMTKVKEVRVDARSQKTHTRTHRKRM
jgi:hypothetical protein